MTKRVLVLAGLAGCYSPELDPCSVRCGSNSPCPADLTCGADGLCHGPETSDLCAMPVPLYVTINGTGAGRVTSVPAGVDCDSDSTGAGCENIMFSSGTMIELTAMPDAGGNTFGGWSGDACAGVTAPICTFTITAAATVNARFD